MFFADFFVTKTVDCPLFSRDIATFEDQGARLLFMEEIEKFKCDKKQGKMPLRLILLDHSTMHKPIQ
jgi:hypothetical protein